MAAARCSGSTVGLRLQVAHLLGHGRLDLVDLFGHLLHRRGDLELLVDLGGDAVVFVQVGGGGGHRVQGALRLGQHVILLVELQRLRVHLRSRCARRLGSLTKAVGQGRAVRSNARKQHAGRELVEQVDTHDTADSRSADDDSLVARLLHGDGSRGYPRRGHPRARHLRHGRLEAGSNREERSNEQEASHYWRLLTARASNQRLSVAVHL
mmetsp:Transcript_60739/g.166435  ORF Transcript_60739/g.166435 Transcript_60739/m.166435 type:complete len:210 (-) Transcript_60739:255-884(-)